MKAVIGFLIIVFALLELSPRFQALAMPPRWLPVGGVLSGFFGGLSGNQGALRSAFLLKAGLSKRPSSPPALSPQSSSMRCD